MLKRSSTHRTLLSYIMAGCLLWLLPACSKVKTPPGTASLNVINVIPGSSPLITNFSGGAPFLFISANTLYYKSYNHFNSFSGRVPLALYQLPDTLSTDAPLLNINMDLPVGSTSTLFVTGTLAKPDTMMVRENLPYHPEGDSTTCIRFVNLSAGSNPVKVVIKGKTGAPEAGSLGYKQITAFKYYPINAAQEEYTFEFRDAVTDALVATYTTTFIHYPTPGLQNAWIYKNCTLALVGIPGGTGVLAPGTLLLRY
jgi:hypothetical protein